ncbi:alpha/beta fold hydrolase [Zhihengliuella flava]|uniref:Pimeloyl-ACP methyl ester carboxylesterase n=1 Tax=Zhihengliuella flava TaxID=1285193 RepID=A0A931DA68_9MICC|nr:alpha/beta hydrolase [Zhihengliuella flava]MBG6085179.1 pimeloyl-ACP methyl ester carboxylesterase [Zhihengliuella flava]
MSQPVTAIPQDDYPEVHATRRPRSDGGAQRTLVLVHDGAAANWSWHRQVEAFGDYRVLTPNLPGYGSRRGESWQGLASAGEDLAAFIAERVDAGRVDVAGLGLGALAVLHVMAHHAELLDAVVLTGVPVPRPSVAARRAAAARGRFPGAHRAGGTWFARVQAGAYGAVDGLVNDAAAAETVAAVAQENYAEVLTGELAAFGGDTLVLAGAKEPAHIQRGVARLQEALPAAQAARVPGVHHAWNLEEPVLFNAVLRRWLERRQLHPRLAAEGEH